MKAILLTIAAFLSLVISTNAQISKGSVLLGGSLSLESSKTTNVGILPETSEYNSFSFSPSIGKAIAENKIVGVGLYYGHGGNENSGQSKVVRNDYGGFVYYRKYLTLGKGFFLFGQSTFSADAGKEKYSYDQTPTQDVRFFSLSFSLSPSVSYAVNKKLHLEAGLNQLVGVNYQHRKVKTLAQSPFSSTTNSFGLYSNISSTTPLTVGVRFLFNL
jgi:hypothetical protein